MMKIYIGLFFGTPSRLHNVRIVFSFFLLSDASIKKFLCLCVFDAQLCDK